MTHRAQQIVQAASDAMTANTGLSAAIFMERSLSLSEAETELPCVNISPGADSPLSELGAIDFAFIDSVLTIEITVVARAMDETTLLQNLMELRRQVTIAMFSAAGRDLGLSFVSGLRYGGAEAPKFDPRGEQIAGAILTRWGVLYRMNISDPA